MGPDDRQRKHNHRHNRNDRCAIKQPVLGPEHDRHNVRHDRNGH